MKTNPIRFIRRTACVIALGVCACEAHAQMIPADKLPKPEEPVVLPTDEEAAQFVANIRASTLKNLARDPDGWDDFDMMIVKAKHKNYKFEPNNKTKDTDKDGMSDYEEMLVRRDPAYAEPVYTKAQQIEMVREGRRQAIKGAIGNAEEQARVRAILEPWMQADVPSGIPGKVFSAEAELEEKRQRMAQRLPALEKQQRDQLEAGKAAAERLGMPLRFATPGGGDAVISGETNGIPDYQFTRNTVSADTISADNLRPGGTSGLNLSGTDFGKPSVRLGVWEPSGADVDHGEFTDLSTIAAVDVLDAAAGWTASASGNVALNTTAGNFQQGTGCLDLRKVAGASASVLYSRTQPTTVNFADRSIMIWYFIDDTATLAVTNAVELRFGSGAAAYWSRSFNRNALTNGWNLLSFKVATATGITGTPAIATCNYTALNIATVAAATVKAGGSQRIDFWRLAFSNIATIDPLDAAAGWTAGTNGSVTLNATLGNCQQGTGCLNLVKTAGSATVLYARTQPAAVNFTDRTVLVWYFIQNPATLAAANAVELRFGSGAGAYWSRSFARDGLVGGWNLLSLKLTNASGTTGTPVITACNYTALNITYTTAATVQAATTQRLDFWRLANSRVTNMDRTGSVADHSTHVTGTMAARGTDAAALGIAFTSEVHARDSTRDLEEMAGIFSNTDPADDLFISNHSYGPDPGWATFFTNGGNINFLNVNVTPNTLTLVTIPAGTYGNGIWNGTIGISGQEDFRFGFYSLELTRPIDQTVYSAGTLLPIWAAGNDRGSVGGNHFETDPALGFILTNRGRPADGGAAGFDSLPPDSVAKNILTVGSVGDLVGGFVPGSTPQPSAFSDYGPTDDGRIKPDICANGEGIYSAGYTSPYLIFDGTSQAAPSLVGTAGLLVELIQRYRGLGYQPPASLIKCVFIHTADDILDLGPDYRSGYGQANAQSAANLIVLNETILNGNALRMVLLQNGVNQNIIVRATGGTPLKITGVSTDPAGTPVADQLDPGANAVGSPNLMLVNDWNIQVTTTGAGPFNPYILDPANPANAATTGINFRDNAEQVLIANPVAGQLYTIVIGPAAGENFVNDVGQPAAQAVALAISGIQPDPALDFRVVNFLQTGANAWTLVWPAVVGTLYRVQTSTDLTTGTWTDVTGDIAAATTYVAREVINATPTGPRRFWRVRRVL